jgi:hypothetical protein
MFKEFLDPCLVEVKITYQNYQLEDVWHMEKHLSTKWQGKT